MKKSTKKSTMTDFEYLEAIKDNRLREHLIKYPDGESYQISTNYRIRNYSKNIN